MRDAPHESEIVDAYGGIDLADDLRNAFPQGVDLSVIRNDGIHVNGGINAAFPSQALLNGIDHIVREEDVTASVHLDVESRNGVSRPVVMYRQIVNAERVRIFGHQIMDHAHGILGGGFPQNGVFGIVQNPDAGDQNKDGHDHTHVCIQVDRKGRKKKKQERCQQNGRGGKHVGKAIRRGGAHDGGIDPLCQHAIKNAEPQLNENGKQKNAHSDPASLGKLGGEDLAQGFAQKLQSDQEDQKGYDHGCHVLDPRVPKGMLAVGGFCRDAEGDHRNDLRSCIREIVHGVGYDGNRSKEGSDQKLGQKQKEIQNDPRDAGKHPVLSPHLRVFCVFMVLNEPTH